MKIRKANIHNGNQFITNVYIYENKKQELSMIAIPDVEWSTIIQYEEEREALNKRLQHSLSPKVGDQTATELASKVVQWVGEM